MSPRLLDLCCGAGLAADGYIEAGFDPVMGVDLHPQLEYPGMFMQGDALGWLRSPMLRVYDHFAAIHASFPCQAHTRAKHLRAAQGGTSRFEDLLTPGLALLRELDIPWVCENVPGAPMEPHDGEHLVVLCGSMFGLKVQRHRLFLANFPISAPGPCDHSTFELDPVTGKPRPWGVYHVPGDSIPKGGRTCRDAAHARECMGVTREVSWQGLKEGLPPAYTRWIGSQLLAHIEDHQ